MSISARSDREVMDSRRPVRLPSPEDLRGFAEACWLSVRYIVWATLILTALMVMTAVMLRHP